MVITKIFSNGSLVLLEYPGPLMGPLMGSCLGGAAGAPFRLAPEPLPPIVDGEEMSNQTFARVRAFSSSATRSGRTLSSPGLHQRNASIEEGISKMELVPSKNGLLTGHY